MALGTLTGIAAGGASALGIDFSFKNVFSGLTSIFKRESCSGTDKQKRQELEDLMRQYFTTDDYRYLSNLANSDISPDARSFAYFFAGGGDCFHKNVGTGDQRFLDQLPIRLEKRVREANQAQINTGNSVTQAGVKAGSNLMVIVVLIIISGFYFIMQQGK